MVKFIERESRMVGTGTTGEGNRDSSMNVSFHHARWKSSRDLMHINVLVG